MNVQWEDENLGESICNALKKEEVTYADIEGITGISIDSQYVVKLDWKDKTEQYVYNSGNDMCEILELQDFSTLADLKKFPYLRELYLNECIVDDNTALGELTKLERRYRYFTLWDIDKDGLKELLVTDGRERVGNSPTKAYAYTYTRGKLRYAGEIGSPMSGISYNCITKRLHASWGGCGNVEYWYYTLTKNKKVKQVICGAYVNGVKNGNVQYKCLYNKKKISLKKWKQITDKWIKQTSTLKYYRNTTSNRKKHMKM